MSENSRKVPRLKIMLLFAFIIGFFAAAALFVSSLFLQGYKKSDSLNGITVVSSHSTFPGITAEISEVSFSGFSPYIKLRWKNDTDSRCIYGEEYDILRKTPDGEWKSSFTDNIWDTLAFILEPRGEKEEKYAVSEVLLPEAGEYRFEARFRTDENADTAGREKITIEFIIDAPVPARQTRYFSVESLIYENGSFSGIVDPQELPDIKITPEMELFIASEDGWRRMGVFTEITLSKDNFDSRIWHSAVTDQISAVDVRAENKSAWQIYSGEAHNGTAPQLFVLLEQTDGSLLFAEGLYNVSDTAQENPDKSYFIRIGILS